MAEYIERESASLAIKKESERYEVGQGDALEGLWLADTVISELPAAKGGPIREGGWINREYGTMVCSFCHTPNKQSEKPRLHFCPNCGAKMDEVAEHE